MIEEQLIELYRLSGKDDDLSFKKALINEKLAEEILINSIAYEKNKNLTKEDVGFLDIEKIKDILENKKRK